MSKDIGNRVAYIRKELGLNQRDFASLLGISSGGISQIESGKTMPGGDFLVRMNQKLGTDLTWLLTGVCNSNQHTSKQPELTPEKEHLLETFEGMTPEQRKYFLEVGRIFTQSAPDKDVI